MKKAPYIPPTVKVVTFRAERGFANSCFTRNTSGDLFEMDLINGAARGERFSVDSWDDASSTQENGQFHVTDWGTL